MTTIAEKAKALADRGFAVFPVRPDKTPYAPDGLKSASLDGYAVLDTFEKYKNALIAIHCGLSGIVVLDIDYKTDTEGNTLVDGFDSLDKLWLPIPESFDYPSLSGNGKHIMYAAPAGRNLPPKAGYRKMAGVDRRSGESYVVFTADSLPDKASLTEAPEWLCDESTVHDANAFEGEIKEWFNSLESGEPSLVVRRAMEDLTTLYEAQGNDLSHSDIVEAQHRAVRLGAEAHPGIEQYLALIEEYALNREGAHSRTPDDYAYEFAEALHSGIQKHGAAIKLRADLPAYSPSVVPGRIPDRLFLGAPGNKADFSALLRALQEETDDDLLVTSILWNAPKTRELSREWGLEFVHSRVLSAREKPEPVKENPSLEEREIEPGKQETPHTFLSAEELERVKATPTFIEVYDKATRSKGYTNPNYVAPAAWTALSMAMGRVAFIPLAKTLEMNLWFITLGASTTGKGTEDGFLRPVLNLTMADDSDTYYNLGALSSPDGLHQSLLERDGKASIIYNDEAADFFRDIRGGKDWMTTVPDKLSKWFDGYVEPSSKISLKDLKGKDARTSLNQMMWGTPDRMLELMDASQFQSGYLARVNWVWDTTQPDPDRKFDLKIQPDRVHDIPDDAYQVAADLRNANYVVNPRSGLNGTKKAQSRINKAANQFHTFARKSVRYEFFKPAVDRLVMETIWKLAGLLALYRGEHEFNLTDALTAIYYGASWLETMMKVAESISESPYSRDVEVMEKYVREQGGSVTEAKLLHHFRGLIVRSRRELTDRIEFLVESGRFIVDRPNNVTTYKINGG